MNFWEKFKARGLAILIAALVTRNFFDGSSDEKADRERLIEEVILMSNDRNDYRTAVVLFAVAVIVAMLAAFVTTFERVEKSTAVSEIAPGTTGLAKARAPLDRAPGQPVVGKWGR